MDSPEDQVLCEGDDAKMRWYFSNKEAQVEVIFVTLQASGNTHTLLRATNNSFEIRRNDSSRLGNAGIVLRNVKKNETGLYKSSVYIRIDGELVPITDEAKLTIHPAEGKR